MKKLLLGLVFLLGTTALATEVVPVKENYVINISAGVTSLSDYSLDGSTVDGDGVGYDFSIEAMKEIKPSLYAGLGFGVHDLPQGETKLKGHTLGYFEDYKSYPIYLVAKYEFQTIGEGVRPFVKANLGYAFNGRVKYDVMGERGKESVDNGIYAAIGFGLEQNNINAGITFKTTHGDLDGNDFDNHRVILSVGYDFDFSI